MKHLCTYTSIFKETFTVPSLARVWSKSDRSHLAGRSVNGNKCWMYLSKLNTSTQVPQDFCS